MNWKARLEVKQTKGENTRKKNQNNQKRKTSKTAGGLWKGKTAHVPEKDDPEPRLTKGGGS